eukprot:TRINITY_DN20453_c0_g1_i1.p1 TRINITY_DN20453_c0_g1~~TRINITY_DN20453_c0_g1_i1.p1  ORF type:complete len:112 (-),score=22.83 TRINITY_DN20453_c0_g1_i1:164-499(-)
MAHLQVPKHNAFGAGDKPVRQLKRNNEPKKYLEHLDSDKKQNEENYSETDRKETLVHQKDYFFGLAMKGYKENDEDIKWDEKMKQLERTSEHQVPPPREPRRNNNIRTTNA